MKKLSIALLVASAAMLASGCFSTRIVLDNTSSPIRSTVDQRWHHGGIYGLVEFSEPIRLDAVCPAGVAVLEQRTTFINGLVQGLTKSLYNPQTVTVYCRAGSSAEVLLDDQGDVLAYLAID